MENRVCLHCGKEIAYDKHSAVWYHVDEFGYYCWNGVTSANPHTQEEEDYRKTRYVLRLIDGVWMVRNPDGEWEVDKYMNNDN